MRAAIGLLGMSVLSACATVPMAPASDDVRGKRFEPAPDGLAALYVYRSGMIGAGAAFLVTVGTRTLGQLAGDTYMRVDVPPGRLDVRCLGGENSDAVAIDATPGSTHFVEITSRPGLTVGPRCGMAETEAATARATILSTTRAAEIR